MYLVTFLMILICETPVAAMGPAPIKIVYYENFQPYSWNENGNSKGILIDVLTEAIQNRLGIQIIHESLPWERAQKMVMDGNADAFSTVPTPWRLGFTKASQETVVHVTFSKFVWKGNPRNKTLRDVRRACELKDYSMGGYLGSGWSKKNLANMNVQWVPHMQNALQMLAAKRFDVFIDVTRSVRHYATQLELWDRIEELPFVIDKMDFKLFIGNKSYYKDILPHFDQAMRDMRQDGTLQRIFEKYQ